MLVVDLELAGFGKVDWVGADQSLAAWAEPAGEVISPEKKAEILARIADWSKTHRVRLDIGPGMTSDGFFARQRAEGWALHESADGSVLAIPPRMGLLRRVKQLFHAFFGP